MFVAYAMTAALLHRYGRDANVRRLLDQAVIQRPIPQKDVEDLPAEPQRVVAAPCVAAIPTKTSHICHSERSTSASKRESKNPYGSTRFRSVRVPTDQFGKT